MVIMLMNQNFYLKKCSSSLASVDKWAEDLDKILGNVDVGDGYGLSWVMYHMVDYCQEKKFTGQVKRLQATISLLDSDQINWDKAFMVAERILEECKQTWGATGRFGG